jgi:hypothetical protein
MSKDTNYTPPSTRSFLKNLPEWLAKGKIKSTRKISWHQNNTTAPVINVLSYMRHNTNRDWPKERYCTNNK